MNKFGVLAAAALAGVMLSGTASATCEIYQDWDFGGQGGVVQPNNYLRFTNQGSPEDRHLPARPEATFYDASWYNQVSGVKLSNGCRATFFMTPGNKLTGHQNINETTARFPEDLNDKTTGMVCVCPE